MAGGDWAAAARMVASLEFWRMAIYWTFSLIFSHIYLLFSPSSTSLPRRRDHFSAGMARPVCVITGATSGLGLAAARALVREGYHIVIAGRCEQLLQKVIQDIKEKEKDANVDAVQVDLSSFQSIMKFDQSIKQILSDLGLHPSIQLLINNAGILGKSLRITDDGLDQMMETNYMGPFVLTHLLLPLLKNSPVTPRIVNVTSFTHRCVSGFKDPGEALAKKPADKFSSEQRYPFAVMYEYSKLFVLLFSYELHHQHQLTNAGFTFSIMAADPGAVETNIMREIPQCLSQLAYAVLRLLNLLQQPDIGVASIIDAALAPIGASGRYFFGGKGRTIKSSALSYDSELAKKLWSASSALFEELKSHGACCM